MTTKIKLKECLPDGVWHRDDRLTRDFIIHDEPFGGEYPEGGSYSTCLSPSFVSDGDESSLQVVTTRYLRDSIDDEDGVQHYRAQIFVLDVEIDGFIIEVVPTFIPEEPELLDDDDYGEFLGHMECEVRIHTEGGSYILLDSSTMREIADEIEDTEMNLYELYSNNWLANRHNNNSNSTKEK